MADVEPAAQPMAVDTQGGGAAKEAGDKDKLRFTLKKWNAVAVWSWSICTDTCAICRNTLHEPSIEYQANPTTASEEGLSVSWGDCGHVFHLDCISKWLRTRSNCSLCNKEWEFSKIEKARGGGGATARPPAALVGRYRHLFSRVVTSVSLAPSVGRQRPDAAAPGGTHSGGCCQAPSVASPNPLLTRRCPAACLQITLSMMGSAE